MTLNDLNELSATDAAAVLLQACGSSEWTTRMAAQRPFHGMTELLDASDRNWLALGETNWFEAFAAHPRIGERSDSGYSRVEQADALGAADHVKRALAEGNAAYEQRFGFTFIVFASGKSPEELLEVLRNRLHNERATEIRNAAAEQMKITRRRLESMFAATRFG